MGSQRVAHDLVIHASQAAPVPAGHGGDTRQPPPSPPQSYRGGLWLQNFLVAFLKLSQNSAAVWDSSLCPVGSDCIVI